MSHKILSVELTSDGAMEVVRKIPSNAIYCSGDHVPDRILKETYICINGKIVHVGTIEGKHTPAKWQEEKIEFPREN